MIGPMNVVTPKRDDAAPGALVWRASAMPRLMPDGGSAHVLWDELVYRGMVLGRVEAFSEDGPWYGHAGDERTGPILSLSACRARVEARARLLLMGLFAEERIAVFRSAAMKIRADLDWRGPAGRKSAYVVLDRDQAAALIGYEERE